MLGVAIVIVALAAIFAMLKPAPVTQTSPFSDPDVLASPELPVATGIRPKNAPVVIDFVGDLKNKGNLENDGTIEPFVVAESLKLEAEAHNAVEYRWKVNGEVLKEKDQEWTAQPFRYYDVTKPGKHVFSLQVRGGEKNNLVSLEKTATLDILPLKIMRVEKNIVHDDDERFVVGDDITLEVSMAQAMGADPDFYQFRYFVNDELIKHPDDDPDTVDEWTHSTTLVYTFPAPGSYTFRVEARRSSEKEPEGKLELPETVIAADAVLLSFDSSPDNEKGVALGAPVWLNSFPVSRYGKSECRFGFKKINVADYTWINDESGAVWGDSSRTWVPTEAGTYLVRCEVRELGKDSADDFREMYFTITDGNF